MYGGDGDGGYGDGDGDSTSWWMRSGYDGGCELRGFSLSSSSLMARVPSQYILGFTWRCQRRVVRPGSMASSPYHW